MSLFINHFSLRLLWNENGLNTVTYTPKKITLNVEPSELLLLDVNQLIVIQQQEIELRFIKTYYYFVFEILV
jgi:hypothetical protein